MSVTGSRKASNCGETCHENKIEPTQKKSPSNSSVKKGKKGFKPGVSGNLKGRPIGSKNKLTQLAKKLLENGAEEIVAAIIEKAKAGDSTAQRLCMKRIMPPIRSSVIQIVLPKLETPQDILKGYDSLFDALGQGDLTLEELDRLSDILENRRKAIETVVLAEEMERIKKHVGLNG